MERRKFISGIMKVMGAPIVCNIVVLAWPTVGYSGDFPKPGKKDRCSVCGMFVYKYPKWAAGFVFKNGAKYFHCCPKCMLHNLLHVPKFQPGEKLENLQTVWVTEYYTTKKMDARETFFVTGTTLVGPMGLDLIPVKGEDASENLKSDYKGGRIVRLDEISPGHIEKARKGRMK